MRMLYSIKRVYDFLVSLIYTKVVFHFSRNIKIGKGTLVFRKSAIVNRLGGVFIGKNCKIGCSSIYYHGGMPFYSKILVDREGGIVTIGDNCRINGAYIHAKKQIRIGNNCVMASGVNIMDSNGHEVYSPDRTRGVDSPQIVSIGNNVWVGINAIILKGTQIGDNCVVSAGSVVKGDFPPNSIIAGNPGVIVKKINIE